MPHFCPKAGCSADTYICQDCTRILCSKDYPSKRVLIPRTGREGNMCPECFDAWESEHGKYVEPILELSKSDNSDYERYEISDDF